MELKLKSLDIVTWNGEATTYLFFHIIKMKTPDRGRTYLRMILGSQSKLVNISYHNPKTKFHVALILLHFETIGKYSMPKPCVMPLI